MSISAPIHRGVLLLFAWAGVYGALAEGIPWGQLGAKIGEQYAGDGLSLASDDDGVTLTCVFQRLEGRATREGLWVYSTAEGTSADRMRIMATGLGRESRLWPLEAHGEVSVDAGVARWVRARLVEEYSVSADGIRQDFVIAERPDGEGDLVVELQVDGAAAERTPNGVGLRMDGSGRKLAYHRLAVTDASGRLLESRFEAGPCGPASRLLRIVLDDAEATFPITIDPVLTSMEKRLLAEDGAANDWFGFSVAAAGDVVVVGSPQDDSFRGAAYVFERHAGGTNAWGQVRKLTASDGAASDWFGFTVAAAGDVIVVGSTSDDDLGPGSGSAYVFERNAGGTNHWGDRAL